MADPAVPERVPSAAPAGPPPKKSRVIPCLIIGICVSVGGLFVLGILAALLLPAITKSLERAKVTACANNLRQLWTLQQIYTSQFGGKEKDYPTETGAAFWLKLSQTTPPLVDSSEQDIFLCPLLDGGRKCDYLGPGQPVKAMRSTDPVGADHPGNHQQGGNVVRKDGSVSEESSVQFPSVTSNLSP